ncbi:SMI1/KNR4 family protein [Arthrobacter sp. D1-29]
MSDLLTKYALERLDVALQLARVPTAWELLNPGIPKSQVREAVSLHGLPNSPELETLYEWHDGTGSGSGAALLGDLWLIPGFYLLSLDEAITNYAAFRKDQRWNQNWFPVFADGGGDFYVIDFANAPARVVRHFRLEEVEHPVEYGSLAAMIDTFAAAFASGAIFVDETGYVGVNDEAFNAIAARMNPDIPWWTDSV